MAVEEAAQTAAGQLEHAGRAWMKCLKMCCRAEMWLDKSGIPPQMSEVMTSRWVNVCVSLLGTPS